jgi:hypothetical protein
VTPPPANAIFYPVSTPATIGPGGIALLCLTLICWTIQIIYLSFVVGREAHGDAVVGQAFAWLAAMLFAGLTWLWLGAVLFKANTGGMMPPWASMPATVLYLASAAATAAAFFLLQDPRRIWPTALPVLLPPILAFYVLALYLPSLRPAFLTINASIGISIPLLILSLAPWPFVVQEFIKMNTRHSEHAKEMEEWTAQEKIRNREANLPKIQAMSPDARLMDWYPLLEEESGVRTEALEALRHIERRQADIEDMLSYGIIRAMMLIPDLDLQPTPQLCEAAHLFLLKNAENSRILPNQDPRPYDAANGVNQILPSLRWLISHGCNCAQGIAAVEASIQTYSDTPDRNQALAALKQMRENQK